MAKPVGEATLEIIREFKEGVPMEEMCRRHPNVTSEYLYKIKGRVDRGWDPAKGNGSKPTSKQAPSSTEVNAAAVLAGQGGSRREPFIFRWGQREFGLDPAILAVCAINYTLLVEQKGIEDSFSEVLGDCVSYVCRVLGVKQASAGNVMIGVKAEMPIEEQEDGYDDGEEVERLIAQSTFIETEGGGYGQSSEGQPTNQADDAT